MDKKKGKKIIFLINPVSGGIDKEQFSKRIRDTFKSPEFDLDLVFTKESGNEEIIEKKIQNEKPDLFAVAGGDGTVNMLAKCLIHTDIPLGIVPMGSANGLAAEMEIPNNIDDSLRVIAEGKSKKVDVVKIGEHYSVHLSDFGLNADVIRRFEEDNIRGYLGYGKHFLKELFSIQGSKYTIITDHVRTSIRANMLVIANASKYGTGAVVNPYSSMNDGYFEIVIIKSYSPRKLMSKIWQFLRGRVDHREFIEHIRTKKATIINHKNKTLQIDGELAGRPQKIEAEVIHKCLRLIS